MSPLWPRRGLWRHPDFLRLWAAQVISAFGSRITRTALPVIAVLSLSGSPMEVAILSAITAGPGAVVALLAGGYIDRSRKRPLLIATDLLRAAAVASLPAAAWLGVLTVAHVYIVAVLVGGATALFEIADYSYLPSLVQRQQLVEGNAKLRATEAFAEVTGPGAAGVLISLLGAPLTVLLDAATYLWSAVFLHAIRHHEAPPSAPAHLPSWRTDITAGIRAIWQQPLVRPLFIAHAITTVSNGFFMALYMYYVLVTLALDTATVGLVIGMGGIGALAGAVLSRHLHRLGGLGPGLIVAISLGELGGLLIPLAGHVSGALMVAFLVAHQLAGDGFHVGYIVHAVSLRQTVMPLDTLGRVNAGFHAVSGLLLPISALLAGFLAEILGIQTGLWIGMSIGLLAPLVLLFSPVAKLRLAPVTADAGA